MDNELESGYNIHLSMSELLDKDARNYTVQHIMRLKILVLSERTKHTLKIGDQKEHIKRLNHMIELLEKESSLYKELLSLEKEIEILNIQLREDGIS